MKSEIELEREIIYAEANHKRFKVLLLKIKLYIIKLGGKKMTKLEKFKKIMKYTMNILAFLNAVLVGLTPIWNIPYGKEISDSIVIIIGAIGTYLIGQKIVTNVKGNG